MRLCLTLILTNGVFVPLFPLAKKDVQDLLKSSGVEADDESLTTMINKLEGKSIPELIAEGNKSLASMPSGGAGGAAAAAPSGDAGAGDEKKEEKEEEKEEEDVDMGDLFGGGDDDY